MFFYAFFVLVLKTNEFLAKNNKKADLNELRMFGIRLCKQ